MTSRGEHRRSYLEVTYGGAHSLLEIDISEQTVHLMQLRRNHNSDSDTVTWDCENLVRYAYLWDLWRRMRCTKGFASPPKDSEPVSFEEGQFCNGTDDTFPTDMLDSFWRNDFTCGSVNHAHHINWAGIVWLVVCDRSFLEHIFNLNLSAILCMYIYNLETR